METVRISADLSLQFSIDKKPQYKAATLNKNQVDGQVKNWLAMNPDGTDKYRFVERWYELFELPRQPKVSCNYEVVSPYTRFPLKPRVSVQNTSGRPLLFTKGLSWCCRARRVLVESMPGGFVTQNCTHCGRCRTVLPHELPDRKCEICEAQLVVRMIDGTNYFYACPGCGDHRKLAALLPHYSELFGY